MGEGENHLLIDIFVLILGLIFGSFYNVVAIRLLNNESFVFPPSHCPQCKQRLNVFDLIPLFSYLFLRGKCRYCQTNISPLYPFGEGLTAVSFYLVYKEIHMTWELLVGFIFVSVLILAVLTDLRQKLILDIITLPALICLLILRLFIGQHSFWFYLSGGLIGFFVLLAIAIISKGGMGGGDIKLYAVVGVALGPVLTLQSLFLASLFGTIVGGFLMLTGLVKRKQPIPFGPFIFLGALLSYLYGDHLWAWYLNFF